MKSTKLIGVFVVTASFQLSWHWFLTRANSPDGRFRMVIYRMPARSTMPGQGGDAPGSVRLYDQRTGRVLEEKDVDMVQRIDQFEWSSTNLHIKLFADWKLPQ